MLARLPLGSAAAPEVCRLLAAFQPTAAREDERLYAVVVTSERPVGPEELAQCLGAGADTYLPEPVPDAALATVLATLAERYALRRRVAAERAMLRARDFRYRVLAATVGDAIYDWDLLSDRIEWSDAMYRLLGYPADSVGGDSQWWVDRVHPEDRPGVMAEVHRVLARREPTFETEYRFARNGGGWANVIDRATVIYDDAGRPARAVGALADVTERRQLADQLRLAQKMEAVGLLAGGIAHDFNNVLTSVLGFAGLLKIELEELPVARSHAEEIESSARRAADLISQLLAFSRRQVLKAEIVDLNDVVATSARMLDRLIGERMRLLQHFDPDLPAVRVDRTQIEQVLVNLVVNARDAMPDGGTATVTTGIVHVPRDRCEAHTMPEGQYVTLSVADTGMGMDEETQGRIFEPFFTTKGHGRGTGLGLATVYGIVKQSGGYIWVTSTPGAGTTFEILLPALQVQAPPVAPEAPEEPVGQSFGETVLVVEDEDSVRHLATQVLERAGYRVLQSPEGESALRAAAEYAGSIDLLLTDVVLPGPSGTEVAQALKRARPDMRVLYMSGYSAQTHGAPHATVARLLPKPFSRDMLLRAVRHALGPHQEPTGGL